MHFHAVMNGADPAAGRKWKRETHFPRIWIIRYKDGYIESAGTDKETAGQMAREHGKLHGGIEVIT